MIITADKRIQQRSVEADFPAWALDYVNESTAGRALASVSRVERGQIESWWRMMAESCDMSTISFGEDEYYSGDPAFGAPCECVRARVLLKEEVDEWGSPVDDGGGQRRYKVTAKAYSAGEDPYSPVECEYEYDCWASSPREAAQVAARNFMGDFNDQVELARPASGDLDGLVDDLLVVDQDGRDVTAEFRPEFDRLCRQYAGQVWG